MIGFDFDGVIFDLGPVIELVAFNDYGLVADEIGCYSLAEVYDIPERQVRELVIICQADRFLTPDRFIPGSAGVLTWYARMGNPIIIITARPRTEPVRRFLATHLDVDPRLIKVFHSVSKDKGECAYQLGLDFLLDDHWVSLVSAMDKGITPLLFDQPWNRKLPVRPNSVSAIQRIIGWPHFVEWLTTKGGSHGRQAGKSRNPR